MLKLIVPPFPKHMMPAFQPESHLSGCKQFVWMGNVSISAYSWISFSDDAEDGYIFQVELCYTMVMMTLLTPPPPPPPRH